VLLVGTVREEEVEDTPLLGQALQELDRESQLARLVLPPLSRADTARLVHALARGRHEATADALVEPVWALSDGNPFAIVESMREAQEPPPGPVDGVPFPRRVREMIDARLRRLGERSRQLAAAVAVAGGEASFGLLRELTGFDGPPAAEAIEELVRRRVLDAVGDGFDFTHDRIRGIVYAGLLPETRQRLHAALGEALESRHAARLDEVADRLAYHYARAERADKAVTYLTRFADAAAGRYALDEAARALHDAQALAERLPDPERTRRLVDLVVRRATCLYLLGRGRELLELLESHEARFEGLADLALLAPFHVWHGYAHGTVGDQARAIQLHERAIDAATRCGDVATLGMAHAGLARECFWAGRCAQAIEHGREAVALLTRTAERWWLGHAHWTLGISHAFRGEFAAALAAEAEARAIGSALGNSRLQGYATWATGWIRSLLGEHAAAIEACRESLALSQDAFNTAFGLGYLGYACLAAGDADQATSHLRDSVERLTQLRMTRSAARVSTWLAEAHFARGEVTEAGSAATRALEATTAAQHRYGMGEAARVLGRIALATGALETAGTRLDEALAIFTGIEARFEVARTHLARAELRERRGDAAGAAADLAEAGRLFERLGLSDRVLRARGAGP
jgi:tetratricopeptide (TPR) repeat protein